MKSFVIYLAKTLMFCISIADYQSVVQENKNSKVHCKSSDLTSILCESFEKCMNLDRIKFVSLIICALCKVQLFVLKNSLAGLIMERIKVYLYGASSVSWWNIHWITILRQDSFLHFYLTIHHILLPWIRQTGNLVK